MSENTIRILKIEVGQAPTVKEIPNTLKAMQAEVDGLIEPFYIGGGCVAVVNEESKLNGMAPNRWLGTADIICGPFFICGDADEDFISITESQIEKCNQVFGEVPAFSGAEPQLKPRSMIIGFGGMGGM
ncbi:DUF3846 domain-containing protein [Bengtsoniella intestinalis]|uniref:DUF3846 domain-containing protein n=1 Tax=Bengtsoniella intestinalis TaxID=3073143 RepID=UPI00391FBB83